MFNPFTATAFKISGQFLSMHGRACKQRIFRSYTFNARTRLQTAYFPVLYFQRTDASANSIFSGPILSVVCIFLTTISHGSAKNKAKRGKGFKFRTFTGHFSQVTSWQ